MDSTDVKKVWLTPCYQHTFGKKLTEERHRIAMTKMLVNKKIKYCGEEIDNKLSGETIDLLELLTKKYPYHQFSFIIGSDNLPTLHRWGRWKQLITKYEFLVFPRAYFKGTLTDFGFDHPSYKLKLISHPLLVTTDISSTNIRQRVKENLSISHLVPKPVEEYIIKNKLYVKG